MPEDGTTTSGIFCSAIPSPRSEVCRARVLADGTLIGAAASRAMDIFIDQIEEATGLGAVMDLLQDLLGGATDPAFLSVVAVAGAFLDTAAAPLST